MWGVTAPWDRWATEYAGPGMRLWAASEPTWGIWNIAEAQARAPS
jgi:hypothetical protein